MARFRLHLAQKQIVRSRACEQKNTPSRNDRRAFLLSILSIVISIIALSISWVETKETHIMRVNQESYEGPRLDIQAAEFQDSDSLNLRIYNFGKVPAKYVQSTSTVYVGTRSSTESGRPTTSYSAAKTSLDQVKVFIEDIEPLSSSTIVVTLPPTKDPLDQWAFDPSNELQVRGKIRYSSSMGSSHVLEYCYTILGAYQQSKPRQYPCLAQ